MKKLLAVCLVLFASVSQGAVRYTYTGASFTSVSTATDPTELVPRAPTLTTSDRVEGHIDVANPLPANDFVLIDSSNALGFAFSAGDVSVSSFARLDSGNDYLYLETGAAGEIVNWDIKLLESTPTGATANARQISLDSGISIGGDRLEIAECADANCSGYFIETASTPDTGTFSGPTELETPGTEARQVPMPLPAMMALGIALAYVGRRQGC